MAPDFVHEDIRRFGSGIKLRATPLARLFKNSRLLGMACRALGAPFLPKAQIYYAPSPFLPDVIGPALRAAIFGRRFVSVIHHVIDVDSRKRARSASRIPVLAEALSIWLIRKFASHVFAGSLDAFEQLRKRRFDMSKISMTSNAVAQSIALVTPLEERAPLVVYLGNLSKRKGAIDLLDVWPKVIERVSSARMIMIGQVYNHDEAEVRRSLHAAGDTVEVLSDLSDLAVAQTLNAAQIYVNPSYEEGWGIAVAEAMAAGCAAITYDLEAFDVVFGNSRVVVETGNRDGLGTAIVHLLSDREERFEMVRRGQRRVKDLSWGAVAAAESKYFNAFK